MLGLEFGHLNFFLSFVYNSICKVLNFLFNPRVIKKFPSLPKQLS